MLTVGKDGSVIEKLKEILKKYLEGASPKYYPPVENLLDLIYEHYTENNSIAPQITEAGKEAKQKEKDLETWLRGIYTNRSCVISMLCGFIWKGQTEIRRGGL